MFSRGWFSLSFFSFSLLLHSPLLFPSDKIPNSDIISTQAGGKVVSQIPIGNGTVTMNTNAPQMPNVSMNINPHIPNNQSSGRSSNAGGLLGFIFNLGKKSSKEIARDKVVADLDRALSRPSLPPTRTPPSHNYNLASNDYPSHFVQAPLVTTPTISTPPLTPSSVPGAQLSNNMTSCTFDYSDIPVNYVPIDKIPSYIPTNVPAVPNMGSLITDNPFKGLPGPYTGGGVSAEDIGKGFASIVVPAIGTKSLLTAAGVKTIAIGSGSTVAGGTAAVAGGGTVICGGTTAGGTVVGGGTVAGGTAAGGAATVGWGAAIIAAAPHVAIVAGAAAATWGTLVAYDGIFNPGIGWNPTYEERQAYHTQRALERSTKAPSLIPQHTSSNNAPQSSNTPNPKKPDDEKEKRAKQIREHQRWTNKEARERAKALGKDFVEKKDKPPKIKDIGFYNGKNWITPDIDGHKGGAWKMFDKTGDTRLGTFSEDLKNKLGD